MSFMPSRHVVVAVPKEILHRVMSVLPLPFPYRLVQVLPTLDFAQFASLFLVRRAVYPGKYVRAI